MKQRVRSRLAAFLCLSILLTMQNIPVYADNSVPVINLGIFEVEMSENSGTGGGETDEKKDFTKEKGVRIEAVEASYTYSGEPVIPKPIISISGNKLTEGVDYKVTITGNDQPGPAKLIIEGLPPFSGTIIQTFEIRDNDISRAKVNYTLNARYRNKPVELNIICIHEGTTGRHIPESSYSVSYLNNDRPGEATAVITGRNGYIGEQRISYRITGVFVAQAPKDDDLLTEYRTVVATGTKWRISPSFNVARVRTTDGSIIGVSRKVDKTRSSGKNKWYYAYIQAKKPGIERIILDGVNGERKTYIIYAENPKIIKNSLKFNDVKTVSMADYITGVTYLIPTSVTSKNTKVATVSEDFSISVSANGSSRITLAYGKRKINTTLTAKLPAFTRAKVTLKNKPVKLKLKNLPKNASISYNSSDPSIVKINSEGFAAPVSNGTVTVYARTGNVTAECAVTVKGLN